MECPPTRYSKTGCTCKRCEFVNYFNSVKPADCVCRNCKKFHLNWMKSPVCQKCSREKKISGKIINGADIEAAT